MIDLRSPYPWFGGKSTVAGEVWSRFGQVQNFVEPFFGSGACLLARPTPSGIETINDFDGFVANFWRALRAYPEAVAFHADWPINENDLHARHAWLVGQRQRLTEALEGDPDYFDAKAAGWWVWGISSWIGSGWCSGAGPWIVVDGKLVDSRQLPHMSSVQGINRKLPHMSSVQGSTPQVAAHVGGEGQLPALAGSKGINRQLPALRGDSGAAGLGINRAGIVKEGLQAYFLALAERMRDVRVACGDFERVLGPSITTGIGLTAIFLDPPYDTDEADCHDAYSVRNAESVGRRAREWAVAHAKDQNLRIALCGYSGEHDAEMLAAGFDPFYWKAKGGYGNQGDGRGRENAKREVIWFSKSCVTTAQASLFEVAA